MDHLHMFWFVVTLLLGSFATLVICLTFDDSAYGHFAGRWNSVLDVVDSALGRAIERVEKW
jgi:hypothetical protein